MRPAGSARFPGETWPNRNFMHAATSDGETDIDPRLYTNKTIFEVLEEHGRDWHIYYDDTPQVWAFVNLWDDPDRHGQLVRVLRAFAEHVPGRQPARLLVHRAQPPAARAHPGNDDPVVGSPPTSATTSIPATTWSKTTATTPLHPPSRETSPGPKR